MGLSVRNNVSKRGKEGTEWEKCRAKKMVIYLK